jgi:hypothetical protein
MPSDHLILFHKKWDISPQILEKSTKREGIKYKKKEV